MFTLPFKKLSSKDTDKAGGKGASLGEMTQAGIPVPPGFVVLAPTFDHFIHEAGLETYIDSILHRVNHKEIHTVEAAAEQIQALIREAVMPKDIASEILKSFKTLKSPYVAVRSSATAEDSSAAAWAGQLESYLNTTEKTLLKHVQLCWASLFTPRAIFYRFEKGLHEQHISVAVVVQAMVQSEVSGIAFSVHPVTQDYNQMIIEAGLGLGEAIVSGQITPDSYVVEKKPLAILDKTINTQERGIFRAKQGNEWQDIAVSKGSKQTLTNKEILELSKLILNIEEHYGFPVDVEWARQNKKFYIVQSRPITTLKPKAAIYKKILSRDFSLAALEIWYRGETSQAKHWTREMQPFLPYIVFERSEGTVHCYYDPRGIDWVTERLIPVAKSDPRFIKTFEELLVAELKAIVPLYRRKAPLARAKLLELLRRLESCCPLLEALWWFMECTPEELQGLNVARLKKLKKETNDLSSGTDTMIRKSLAKLYPRLGQFVGMLSLEEIRSEKFPSLQTLRKRDTGFFYTDNKLFVGVSREVVEGSCNIKLEQVVVEKDSSSIKGQVGYKGVVRGVVRRVMGHGDIDKIRAGEVLVSPMTMPDFLPAMRKAVAFVTDEGGITCHAAIAAREMKKPCVIGTRVATQLLQNGDTVEVDANTGQVRILSS